MGSPIIKRFKQDLKSNFAPRLQLEQLSDGREILLVEFQISYRKSIRLHIMRKGQTSLIHFLSRILVSIAGFATNLYVANELGSEPLGTYFLALSVITWVALFANLGVQESVKKRLSEAESSWGYVTTGLALQTILYVLVSVAILALEGYFESYIGAPLAELLVLVLTVRLAYDFVVTVLDGQNKVHLSSLLDLIWWVGRSILQISLVALGVGLVGLFWGYIAAGVVAVFVGIYFAQIRWETPSRIYADKLISYAQYSWLSPLQGRSFLSMDTIILGFFVSNSFIGIYEIAWNLASFFSIFGTSISKTLFPEISSSASKNQSDRVRQMTSSALSYAGLFLIPGLVGSLLLGKTVLSIYGEEFSTGYHILLILIIARLIRTFEAQLTNSLDAINHPEETFRINGYFIILNGVLNIVFVWQYGWIGAAVATTLAAAFGTILSYRVLSRYIDVRIPTEEILYQVISALIMGGVVFIGKSIFGTKLSIAIPLILIGIIIYFGVLITISKQFRNSVRDNIPHQFIF